MKNEDKATEALLAQVLRSSSDAAMTEAEIGSILESAPELTPEEGRYFSNLNPLGGIKKRRESSSKTIPFPFDPMLFEQAAFTIETPRTSKELLNDSLTGEREKMRAELLKRLASKKKDV